MRKTVVVYPTDWWHSLVEQAPVAMSVVDLQGRQLAWNTLYARLFGYGPDELSAIDVARLTAPTDLDTTAAYLRDLAEGRTPQVTVEKTYVRADGSTFLGRLTAAPLRVDGEVVALAGVIEDITEWRAAAEARRRAEAKYRRVIESLSELVCEWDADGVIRFVNESYRQFFGVGPEVVGMSLFDLIPPEARAEQEAILRRVRDDMTSHVVQRTYDDGRTVAWLDTVLRQDDGVSVVSVGRDISARVRAEEEVRAQKRRLEAMVSNIYDSVLLLDGSARLLETTSQFRSDLGHPTDLWQDELDLFSLLHPDDVALAASRWSDVLAAPGADHSAEVRLRTGDGTWANVELDAVNLLEDPDVRAVVLTARNITRRKQVEEELERKHQEAHELSQSRSALVAMVSHELRNPIHGILGLAELLVSAELAPAEQELAESIHTQVSAMRRTLDDLLDLARLQAGGVEIEHEPVDIRRLAEGVVDVARRTADRPLAMLTEVAPGTPPLVWGDEHRLRQVLTNLVGNAVKFTPEGSVTLRVGPDHELLRIEVADTGVGIPALQQEAIFQEFVQVGTGDRRGAGLGLAIVRALVEAMGGRVRVRSTVGVGSTFTVELPLAPAVEAWVELEPVAVGTVRVLVVEDDPVNQLVARKQLERLGAVVEVVGTGADALDALERTWDLVLMDFLLPDTTGLEVARELRRRRGADRPPVVAVTASVMAADRQACLEAGMDDFLAKPVGLDDLRRVLARYTPVPEQRAVPAAPPTGIDREALERLADDLGDRETVRALVRTFLAELPPRCDAIVGALQRDDQATVRRVAHTLKSAARLVGAEDLARLCASLEADPSSVDRTELARICGGTADDLRAFA